MKLKMGMKHLPLPLVSLRSCLVMTARNCHLAKSESGDGEDGGDDDGVDDDAHGDEKDACSDDWRYFHRARVNCSHLPRDLIVEPLTLLSYRVDLIDRHLMLYPLKRQVTLR